MMGGMVDSDSILVQMEVTDEPTKVTYFASISRILMVSTSIPFCVGAVMNPLQYNLRT